eukprot:11206549-Lingulodinium_polyedra.AAC.1
MDILCPRLRYFNVRRAKTGWYYKTGTHTTRGYAFPQKVWYQSLGTWKYKRLALGAARGRSSKTAGRPDAPGMGRETHSKVGHICLTLAKGANQTSRLGKEEPP